MASFSLTEFFHAFASHQLDKVRGHIQFKDIRFRYPTRPDVPILNGINLELQPGKTLALVRPHQCGDASPLC